jgi:hypothetical protein
MLSEEKFNTLKNEEEYKPPSSYGLRNSEPIIPNYYIKKFSFEIDDKKYNVEYLQIDYLQVIKDDIKNMRKLNVYQIDYIKNCINNETKNELLQSLSTCIDFIIND